MQPLAVAPTAAATGVANRTSFDQMTTEDFFQLLVAELQQQDPFEPTKTADMISQVSQIRDIEQSYHLTNTLEQLTNQQRTAGATDLLGKFVQALIIQADGSAVGIEGVVTGLRFGLDGTAVLELDTGQTIRSADVIRVTTLAQAEMDAAAESL